MKSSVTTKYQTTVPKPVREKLGISVNDTLEWVIERGKASVYPVRNAFLQYRNSVKVGKGKIKADIEASREARVEKYR